MTDEATPTDIISRLAQVAHDLGPIGKDDRNESQGFAYRGIETVLAKAGPLLAAHGVVPAPKVTSRDVEVILVGKFEKPWRLVSLTVDYTFHSPDGTSLTATTVGEGFDPGDKAANKAMSAAYKYALMQVLMIAGGHDEADADAAADPAGRKADEKPKRGPTKPKRGPEAPAPKGKGKAQDAPDYNGAPKRDGKPLAAVPNDPVEDAAAQLAEKFPGSTIEPDPEPPTDDGDPRREVLTLAMDGIEDADYRREVKRDFVAAFGGPPAAVTPDRLDTAVKWVEDQAAAQPF